MRFLALIVALASSGCASSEKRPNTTSTQPWSPVEFGPSSLELLPIDPKVESRLSSEEVLEVLQAREDKMMKCFVREAHEEQPGGGVVFEWSIDAEGVTSSPRVVEATAWPPADLVNCMRGALRVQFPVHRGAALLVRHHLKVSSRSPLDGGTVSRVTPSASSAAP